MKCRRSRSQASSPVPAHHSDRVNIHAALFARHHGLVRTRELLAAGTDTEMIRWTRNYRAIVRVRQGWWALPGTDARLHIEVPEHSSYQRAEGVVVHWASDQRNGDRRAVSVEVARQQASRCRVANGTL